MQSCIFQNARLITPFEERDNCHVAVRGSLIHDVSDDLEGLKRGLGNGPVELFDVKGSYLVPGFIDIHTHGGGGVDAYSPSITPWIDHKSRNGVTSFLPTLAAMPLKTMYVAIKSLVDRIREGPAAAKLQGINLEGPYLNPRFGLQLPESCLAPRRSDWEPLLELAQGLLRIMTVAPELEGSEEMIRELVKRGVTVSIGHSDATLEEAKRAVDLGARLITHTFNAFGLSGTAVEDRRKRKVSGRREVRALEYLLQRDDVYGEIIPDRLGLHVHPVLINILLKCKGIDRVIVITDSISAAGLPDGTYTYPDGRQCVINSRKYDVAWLEEGSVLGGTIYSLIEGARSFMRHTGVGLRDALKTITINPARLLGLDSRIGSIQAGKQADLVVMDGDFNVALTMVEGRVVYERTGRS